MKSLSPARTLRAKAIASVVTGLLLCAPAVHAAAYSWNCANSWWDIVGCWNPSGATPGPGDTVFVATFGGGAETNLKIDSLTGTATAEWVIMDASPATLVRMYQTGGTLNVTNQTIASTLPGNVEYQLQAGTHNVSNQLAIGNLSSTHGRYLQNGGTLAVGGSEWLGPNGTGTFDQNAGTHTIGFDLYIGAGDTGIGTYNLNGGTLTVNNNIAGGGSSGTGTLNIDGGALAVAGSIALDNLRLGSAAGRTGVYTQSGSTVTVTDEILGLDGTGTYTQDGGIHTVTNLGLGQNATGAGTYNLNAGTLTVNGNIAGGDGAADFNYSGGMLTVNGNISDLDSFTVGPAVAYSLSGGHGLTAIAEFVAGNFTHFGGTNTVGGSNAATGIFVSGNGGYELSGSGVLNVVDYGSFVLSDSAGVTHNGGASTINNTLFMGAGTVYNLNAGSLTTGASSVGSGGGGAALFTQWGGSHLIEQHMIPVLPGHPDYIPPGFPGYPVLTPSDANLTLGASGANGSYELRGGTLTVNGNIVNGSGTGSMNIMGGTLVVDGTIDVDSFNVGVSTAGSFTLPSGKSLTALNQQIGIDATGTFVNAGGTNAVVNNLLLGDGVSLNGNGTYTLDAGTLAVNNNVVIGNGGNTGTLNVNGGTATVANGIVNGSGTGTLNINGGVLSVGGGDGSIDVDNFNVGVTGSHELSGAGSLTATSSTINGVFTQSGGTHTAGTDPLLGGLNVGMILGSTGSYELTAGSLLAARTYVGVTSTGGFTQGGGTHQVNGALLVGVVKTGPLNGVGTYEMTGGDLTASVEAIGLQGDGSFTQTGGTNTVDDNLALGVNPGSTGRYDLDAGTLAVGADMHVGGSLNGVGGTGLFDIDGGSATVAQNMTIWDDGTVNVDGGTLTVLGNVGAGAGTLNINGGVLSVGGGDGSIDVDNFNVGVTGSHELSGAGSLTAMNSTINGAFTQSGGTHTSGTDPLGSGLSVGASPATGASYVLTGGSVLAARELIGVIGGGDFIQDGGTNLVEGALVIGVVAASGFTGVGYYHLNNGNLTVDGEVIGFQGIGRVTQGGGSHTVVQGLALGVEDGSSGRYDLDGGTLAVGTSLHVGGSTDGVGGTGLFNVNGGVATVAQNLTLWDDGTVNLAGGTLNVGRLDKQGSTFNFIAGTLNLTNSDLVVGNGGPLGSAINLSAVQSLSVSGTTTLAGAGLLTLNGGTFSTGKLVNNGSVFLNRGTFNLTNEDLVIGGSGPLGAVLSLGVNQTFNVTHNVIVESGGLLYLNNGRFTGGAVVNNGEVRLDGPLSTLGGGTLTNNDRIVGDGRVTAALANAPGAEVRVQSGDELQFTSAGNANDGNINILGGTVEFTQDLTNNAGGKINGQGQLIATGGLSNEGTMAFSSLTTNVFGDVSNVGTGNIFVSGRSTVTFFDDVANNGAELRVSDGSAAVFFGNYSGVGPLTGSGDLFFEGGFSIGASPFLQTVPANVTFGFSNVAMVELGGTLRAPGSASHYDALDVIGGKTLTLGGILDVVLIDDIVPNYMPVAGDMFLIYTAAQIIGDFREIKLPDLGNSLKWLVSNDGQSYSLAVAAVPLPGGFWLLASALSGFIAVRRVPARGQTAGMQS
ncbi:MAG: beta strand repeat-containing protein [Gammaproteobacteria bacterium]